MIKNMKEELKKSKQKIKKLNDKVIELESKLKSEQREYLDKIKELEKKIIIKDEELRKLKEELKDKYNLTKNNIIKFQNKDKCVNFISTNQKVFFAIPCSGDSIFAEVEELLYREYPEYRETNNTFLANGREVLRFKTINDNNIGSGKPVTLVL